LRKFLLSLAAVVVAETLAAVAAVAAQAQAVIAQTLLLFCLYRSQ
jgi:hypothetical protein